MTDTVWVLITPRTNMVWKAEIIDDPSFENRQRLLSAPSQETATICRIPSPYKPMEGIHEMWVNEEAVLFGPEDINIPATKLLDIPGDIPLIGNAAVRWDAAMSDISFWTD